MIISRFEAHAYDRRAMNIAFADVKLNLKNLLDYTNFCADPFEGWNVIMWMEVRSTDRYIFHTLILIEL